MFAQTQSLTRSAARWTVVAFASIVLVAACGKKEDAKKAAPTKVEAAKDGAKPTVADQAAKSGADDSKAKPAAGAMKTAPECDSYASSLCEIAGKTSGTCTSIKTTLALLPAAACKAGMADLDYSKKQLASMPKPCDDLVKKLCADLGEDTQTCKMVREKTPAFGDERCTQMMATYPKVVAQLKQMESANKPLTPDKMAKLTTGYAGDFGSKTAKVTIVEFSDFQCPYCTKAATATSDIKKKYGDKVRIIFRQFPLSFHKQAHLAAQASLAAKDQGKFWEMHDKMFQNQRALQRADLDKYAKELGLDMTKFKAALDSGKYKKQVDDDMKLGQEVAVQGTPTMFLNGTRVGNAGDANSIGALIDAELKK